MKRRFTTTVGEPGLVMSLPGDSCTDACVPTRLAVVDVSPHIATAVRMRAAMTLLGFDPAVECNNNINPGFGSIAPAST